MIAYAKQHSTIVIASDGDHYLASAPSTAAEDSLGVELVTTKFRDLFKQTRHDRPPKSVPPLPP